MGNDGLEGALTALYEGTIDFNEFERRTRQRWQALAAGLRGRWTQPGWNAHEDVVQDLLIGAWRVVWDWQKQKGPIDRYVVYNACDWAKRRMHKARGAKLAGTADKNPSRQETPLSRWDDPASGSNRLLERFGGPGGQLAHLERQDALERALGVCKTVRERAVVTVLSATDDLQAGADALYADRVVRKALGLRSGRHAVREVVGAAGAVAQRMAEQEARAS